MAHVKGKTGALVVAALGVVFGDIGTSPLYTLKVCFSGQSAVIPSRENIFGLVSLIFWSLILVVSVKYALFILKADDDGEGGDFAMLAVLHRRMGSALSTGLIMAGLFSSALLYGDGLITPVISVLSALEGLEIATTSAKPLILPLTCFILFILFWAQSHGTGKIGRYFGPVMILWFCVIGGLGATSIYNRPEILESLHPVHAVNFFMEHGFIGFILLGAVVLCVTGCEALFLDMGHFGSRAIRFSWYFVAFPALVLNYFGQGAAILNDPRNSANSFFALVPQNLLYPMVVLATTATIIASQAIISGVFSLTRQAIQLGFMPRMRITHTSEMAEGQVYLPGVNGIMMIAAIALALHFQASDNLADAYGIAVTGTMLITSTLFFFVTRKIWGWSIFQALPLCLLFWTLDAAFFGACLQKFATGGWFPIAIAIMMMAIMVIWWDGWKKLAIRVVTMTVSKEKFMEMVRSAKPIRLPGTGVFLSNFQREVPPMLYQYVRQTRALPETLILLSVLTTDSPETDESQRLEISPLGDNVYRVTARYGFMESPDIPMDMAQLARKLPQIDLAEITYYIGRLSLMLDTKSTSSRWRRSIFIYMLRNSLNGAAYLQIPPSKVMEIGVQVMY